MIYRRLWDKIMKKYDNVLSKLKTQLSTYGYDLDDLDVSKSWLDNGFDDLDFLECVVDLESEFDIEINEHFMPEDYPMNDFINYVCGLIQ
jgi:acyl carrier protein